MISPSDRSRLGHYLRDEAQGAEPHASPLRAESLAGWPPAHVVTAEYDPMRDEGEAYAERLKEVGVLTTLTRYDGLIHGFFGQMNQVPIVREAIRSSGAALRNVLRGGALARTRIPSAPRLMR